MTKATVNVYMQLAGAEQDLFHVCSFDVDADGSRGEIGAALRELAEAFETEQRLCDVAGQRGDASDE
jgi:hypothetical protein